MMGSFTFVHCADLHLGSPFAGVASDDEALGRKMRASTFKALDRIVAVARKRGAGFIVFSGDIFDSDSETPSARMRFCDAVERAKVPCYIAYGNHDYRRRWEDSIPLPPNAHVFGEEPERFFYPNDDEPVAAVYGASMARRNVESAPLDGFDGTFGVFNIGVLHCNLESSSEGRRYADCRLEDLLAKDMDYWALGHIHRRQVVHEFPHVVYPGNAQGRSPKESGEKGAYIVTVRNGTLADIEFFRAGPILWSDVEADITGCADLRALIKSLPPVERGSFIRVRLTGRGPLDRALRLDRAGAAAEIEARTGCTVTGLDVATFPDVDLDERMKTGDFISAVIALGRRMESAGRAELIDAICSTNTSEALRPRFEAMDDSELRALSRDAVLFVVERLTEEAGR